MTALRSDSARSRDRGAIDGGLEVLVGGIMVICFVLVIVETVAYWHTSTIMDDAASEGARIAAAFDGTCDAGRATAQDLVDRRATSWADSVTVTCDRAGGIVTVRITGHSPGLLFGRLGFGIDVVESAPTER